MKERLQEWYQEGQTLAGPHRVLVVVSGMRDQLKSDGHIQEGELGDSYLLSLEGELVPE